MAGPARYTAVLDACVLYPAPVADALVSLHVAGVYCAKWTTRIDDEWVRAVLREKPDLADKLGNRRDAMRKAVLDWEVPAVAVDALVPCLELPDEDDRHVLAAAIAGHADCIVTSNLKDFPSDVVGRHGIEVIHPDDFVVLQIELAPLVALAAFKEMRARLRNPALNVEEFVQAFERSALAMTAQQLREAAELI